MSSEGSSRRSRSPRCVVASISCGSGPPSLVPEIYVTSTDTSVDRSRLPGMDGRRDSTNSNLSCSLPNLATDDLDLEDGVDGAGGRATDMSLYCSPRSSRRNNGSGSGSGSGSGDGNPSKRLNGQPNYPFLKCIGKHRERVESTDSNESDCSASHQSTCATSDYTHLTSLDMINILSMREQYHAAQTLGSNMDLSVEYGTLRRTHSNPENCVLSEEETKQVMESSDSSLRDSKSCTNLEAEVTPTPLAGAEHRHGNHLRPEAQQPARPPQAGSDDPEVDTALLHPGNKPLAVSEENLHSRVNRWLGNVDTDNQKAKPPAS